MMMQRTANENAACYVGSVKGLAMILLRDSLCLSAVSLSRQRHDLWPFLYLRRIIRPDELGQTFVVRLVMRL